MADPLRPEMDWGTAAQRFAAETGTQTLLCVICVSEGTLTAPAQVVVLSGSSYCLPHSNLIKLGPVT